MSKCGFSRKELEDEIVRDEVTYARIARAQGNYEAVVGILLLCVIDDIENGLYRQKDLNFSRFVKKIEARYKELALEVEE